jgi:hypothetical protein
MLHSRNGYLIPSDFTQLLKEIISLSTHAAGSVQFLSQYNDPIFIGNISTALS